MAGSVIATWLIFLIVTIAAARLGTLAPKIALPLITGYLLVGAMAGPFVLNVVQKEDIPRLGYVTQFALAFIAFSAGAELYLPELRSLFRKIISQTTGIAIASFTLCTVLIFGLGSSGVLPWMAELDGGCRLSVSSIAAAIMVARSPASAIAVVKEMKAKGTFTSTMLGVTVLCDVYVLLLFTLTSTIAESECKGEGFSVLALAVMAGTMISSVLLGWLCGKLLLFLMLFKRFPARYLILPLGLAIFVGLNALTDWSHDNLPVVINLEPLLLCIVGGYVCTNQSKHRHRFISVLQRAGPYVFLPFFTLVGASLDLRVLVQSFGFAAITAAFRAFTIFVGSATGGWLSGQAKSLNMIAWMTLLTQAGVSLGLASEVGMSFPEWGRSFQTSIISVVLVNQIVGPVLFKIAIRRAGEAGKAASDGQFDEDAEIPTAIVLGGTPDALSVTSRLLKQRWRVLLVAATQADADAATAAVKDYAVASREAEARARGVATTIVQTVVTKPVDNARGVWQRLTDRFAGAGRGGSGAGNAAAAAAVAGSGAAHVRMTDGTDDASPTPASGPAGIGGGAGAGAVELTGAGVGAKAPTVPEAGAAGAGAGATPQAQQAQHHDDHDHEHGRKWLIEEYFEAVPLVRDGDGVAREANPFLVVGNSSSGSSSSAASGGVLAEAAALAGAGPTATPSAASSSSQSSLAAAAAIPNPFADESGVASTVGAVGAVGASTFGAAGAAPQSGSLSARGGGGGGGGGAGGTGHDASLARLAQLVQSSSRNLQAVAALLPSDAANLACVTMIDRIISAAPRRSHLHSVRVVAGVREAAWAPLFEGLGVIPLHGDSAAAAAAARVLMVPPGKPTILLPAAPNDDELAKVAVAALIGGAPLAALVARAPTQVSSSGSAAGVASPRDAAAAAAAGEAGGDPAAMVGRSVSSRRPAAGSLGGGGPDAAALSMVAAARAARKSVSLAGGGSAGDGEGGAAGAAAASGSSGFGGMLRRAGVEAEEVPPWERDNYLAQLASVGEESSGMVELEGSLQRASKRRAKDDIEMFGSVSQGLGLGGSEEGDADGASGGATSHAGHGTRGAAAEDTQHWP